MSLCAQAVGKSLTERVSMSSGVPLMDNYAQQNYLDNSLRGGMPIDIGSPAGAANAEPGHKGFEDVNSKEEAGFDLIM